MLDKLQSQFFFFWRGGFFFIKGYYYTLKGALSGLRQFLAIGRPLKMMKNVFYFTSRAFFRFQDI